MSARERVYHLVNELSEADLLLAERMLRGLKLPPEQPAKPTPEQRFQAAKKLREAMRGISTEAYFAEKHADLEREEVRLRGQNA